MSGASGWTSLELAKLAVSVLTPLLLVVLGVVVSRAARRVEQAQWASRRLIERRIELYDQLAPLLNDLFCFFTFVGSFKAIDPPRVVDLKRELDKIFYVNRYLFGESFCKAYEDFMSLCFMTYYGAGQDAKLRAAFDRQREMRGNPAEWKADWAGLFTGESRSSEELIKEGYELLMTSFARELGISAIRASLKGQQNSRRGVVRLGKAHRLGSPPSN
jgi:hypothetical protein